MNPRRRGAVDSRRQRHKCDHNAERSRLVAPFSPPRGRPMSLGEVGLLMGRNGA